MSTLPKIKYLQDKVGLSLEAEFISGSYGMKFPSEAERIRCENLLV